MRPPEHPIALALLGLPALLYGAAVRLRNRYYDRPGRATRAPIPVVSVGNISVGGTGKTPVVAWLAERLRRSGRKPAVVSRGYGGSSGKGPLLVEAGPGTSLDAAVYGDEPCFLARLLPGVPVIVGSDRVAGAGEALRRGADLVLLDDGFQHRRLARDLDIVLLDAGDPFGRHRLLPAGLLREPLHGLRRADVILITRGRRDESFPVIEKIVRRHNPSAPLLRAGHRTVGFVDGAGEPVGRPGRALAFCGIGNPARFRSDLLAEGVELVDFRVFRDHHPYSAAELGALREAAATHGAVPVTTEKDLARIAPGPETNGADGLCALRIEAEPFEPERLLRSALEAVGGGGS